MWTEARTVSVKRGLLSVLLGDTAPIPDSVKFDRPYWLGIQLGSSAELSPRTELTAVGYSFRSVRADTAQFAKEIAPGTVVRVVNGITDEVTLVPGSNISINTIGNTLRISAGGGGEAFGSRWPTHRRPTRRCLRSPNTGFGGAISGESKQGGIGVFGQSNYVGVSGFSSGGTGVQGGGPTRGVYGLSDLGTGVEGGHTLQSGTSPGVYGWSASQQAGAVGILGELTSTSAGASSVAVKGLNKGTGDNGTGVYGATASTNGAGVYGEASGTGGSGVVGVATTINGGGVGVYGETRGGLAGTGVFGVATGSGLHSGVRGEIKGGLGYGVYSTGNMGASGVKPFRIDHPKDPTGKYLLHYSAESPDVLNMYTGNVVTDANGYATIALPDYFEDINKDPRYTLTVINEGGTDFVQAMVVQKIRNNRFVIRTSKPAIEVSWRVDAVRNDLWVRTYGAPVQVEKQGLERGKYQHPELYGMPEEMGINYRPENENAGGRSQNLLEPTAGE